MLDECTCDIYIYALSDFLTVSFLRAMNYSFEEIHEVLYWLAFSNYSERILLSSRYLDMYIYIFLVFTK